MGVNAMVKQNMLNKYESKPSLTPRHSKKSCTLSSLLHIRWHPRLHEVLSKHLRSACKLATQSQRAGTHLAWHVAATLAKYKMGKVYHTHSMNNTKAWSCSST